MADQLCPAQERAFAGLMTGIQHGSLLLLHGGGGMGRTTVLRRLHEEVGGAFLTIKDLIDAMQACHPLALEETFGRLVMEALTAHPAVILDDFDLLGHVV